MVILYGGEITCQVIIDGYNKKAGLIESHVLYP